jgi:hypothetical protein
VITRIENQLRMITNARLGFPAVVADFSGYICAGWVPEPHYDVLASTTVDVDDFPNRGDP